MNLLKFMKNFIAIGNSFSIIYFKYAQINTFEIEFAKCYI